MQTSQTSPIVLSIAGSDPSGGAGIQCDLKTFMGSQSVWYGNTNDVDIQKHQSLIATHPYPHLNFKRSNTAPFRRHNPHAIKIGALSNYKQAQVLYMNV